MYGSTNESLVKPMNQFFSQVNLIFEFDNYGWEYNILKNSTKINLGCKILGKLHIYKISNLCVCVYIYNKKNKDKPYAKVEFC